MLYTAIVSPIALHPMTCGPKAGLISSSYSIIVLVPAEQQTNHSLLNRLQSLDNVSEVIKVGLKGGFKKQKQE